MVFCDWNSITNSIFKALMFGKKNFILYIQGVLPNIPYVIEYICPCLHD